MTRIIKNMGLDDTATSTQTGTICEPSVAASGKRMMITGNWFASRTTDGGQHWSFVDPFSELPSTGPGVCCDQLIHYSKSKRLWVWLLQFIKTPSGNIFRVAVSNSGAPGTWAWWDTAPTDIDPSWSGLWFDYPDLVETNNHLLLSFNLFTTATDRWQQAAVIRFSMDELKARGSINRQAWSSNQVGSLRFARGSDDSIGARSAGEKAVFASHGADTVVIHEWPDAQSNVVEFEVNVTPWRGRDYQSLGPDGKPWLKRVDGRITAGWNADGVLGFAWTAAADSTHPHPYIRAIRVDDASGTLIDEPNLWSSECAWAYPAASPNRRGDVGLTAFCGGQANHPAHAVGFFDEKRHAWDMSVSAISTDAPHNGAWGDYLDIQPDPSRKTYWVASGFTLNGGSNRRNVEPRVVIFGP